ncbi:MAG TPA: DUF1566 domain-containing protein, partial [Gammaproteobacteria bacterium]|nr:DUF1566 domain-containing protein [Gammaproteobacteria bacterium]
MQMSSKHHMSPGEHYGATGSPAYLAQPIADAIKRWFVGSMAALLLLAGQVQAICNNTIPVNTPTSRFVINGDGTVTDSDTGLMWKRCAEGQTWDGMACTGTVSTYTWQQALQQVQILNAGGGYAGYSDWRVPNIKELGSIVERQCYDPAINETVFPGTPSSGFWSSSSTASFSGGAWNVGFDYGGDDNDYSKSFDAYVRLVRGGQSFTETNDTCPVGVIDNFNRPDS